MRVSTSQIYDTGTAGILRNQSGLMKTQNQLSTGRRVLAPEDDPVASAQALLVTQSKEVNDRFIENQGAAKSQLGLVETTLKGVGDELQNIFDRAVQAGNSSLSPEQRGMIAQELKVRLDDLVAQANTQDGSGNYVFSGFQSQTRPFQTSGANGPYSLANQYMNYKGDDGKRMLQVGPSQEMAISETGTEVFMQVRDGQGNLTGRSLFDSVKNLVDILDPNSGVPYTQTAYNQALNDMHANIANVSRVRASVGARLAQLDSLSSTSDDLKLQYQTRLSDLQDLDYASAITDLSRQQMQLQAAQQSFKQTSQLTLFNIL